MLQRPFMQQQMRVQADPTSDRISTRLTLPFSASPSPSFALLSFLYCFPACWQLSSYHSSDLLRLSKQS